MILHAYIIQAGDQAGRKSTTEVSIYPPLLRRLPPRCGSRNCYILIRTGKGEYHFEHWNIRFPRR